MQTLVYIIGGYCLIKAVVVEYSAIRAVVDGAGDQTIQNAFTITAFLFLASIEAFNQ